LPDIFDIYKIEHTFDKSTNTDLINTRFIHNKPKEERVEDRILNTLFNMIREDYISLLSKNVFDNYFDNIRFIKYKDRYKTYLKSLRTNNNSDFDKMLNNIKCINDYNKKKIMLR